MSKATIDEKGFQEADELLAKLELEVREKALGKALRAAGQVVRKEGIRRAPDGMKSGNSELKSKRKAHEIAKRLKTAIRIIVRKYSGSSMAVVGADYNKGPHAHLVEDGHDKVLWGRRTGEEVDGKEFFAPAADATKDAQTDAFVGSLKTSIKQAGG